MHGDIGFLGVGHMGMAVLKGVLAARLVPADTVLAVDHRAAHRDHAAALGCRVSAEAADLRDLPVVMLCTRPQDFAAAAQALRGDADRLAISVMAGVESAQIGELCGPGTRVVRAMPNAPAAIGAGMTAVAAGRGAGPEDVALATRLFSGVGRVVEVPEPAMHAVTAVSGSGPAWFYLLAEAIREEGLTLGLDPGVVDTLIRGTIDGAAAMMRADARTPAELRAAVTTPGGTTEAGLAAMQEAGFIEAARAGVRAACRRGETLAKG